METKDISFYRLICIYGLLLFPFAIILYYRIPIFKQAAVAIARMTIQLSLVGFYLIFLFEQDSVFLNLLWLLIMLVVANYTVLKNTGLNMKLFFPATFIGITVGTVFITLFLIKIAVDPEFLFTARYLIPISGMVMGNSLRANVISLERFYGSINKNRKEFLTYLMMGATLKEAIRPYLKDAIKVTLAPTVSTMSTIGLVSLPGMMTGQILGGSIPLVAIKYQIAIMLAIFGAIAVSTLLNILLSLNVAFNKMHILRKDIFVK